MAEILRVSFTEVGNFAENRLDLDEEDFDPFDPTHLFWGQREYADDDHFKQNSEAEREEDY